MVTALGIGGGWLLNRAFQQRAAIRHYCELSSHLPPEHYYNHYITIGFALTEEQIKASKLPRQPTWRDRPYQWLGGDECWGQVVRVLLNHTAATDDDLRRLAALPALEELELAGTNITDGGLPLLHACPQLRYVDLADTSISDEGLAHLAALGRLEALSLDRTRISDDGLRHLTRLEGLQSLTLRGTGITDEGVPYLAELTALTELFVPGTAITEEGHRKLQAQLPHCRIRRSSQLNH